MKLQGIKTLQQHFEEKALANCLEIKCTASDCEYFFSKYKSKRARQDSLPRSKSI